MLKQVFIFFLCAFLSITIYAQDVPITPDNAGDVVEIESFGRGYVELVAYSPNGQTFAIVTPLGIWLYDVDALDVEPRFLKGHTNNILSIAYNPDGTQIISSGMDGTIRIWDVATGEQISLIDSQTYWVYRASFSPDNRQIVAGGYSGFSEMLVEVWEIETGELIHTLYGHEEQITEVSYSADGEQITSVSSDGMVRIWDAVTGELIRQLTQDQHNPIQKAEVYSPDGAYLLLSVNYMPQLQDAKTGEVLHQFEGYSLHGLSVAYHPDGKSFAVGSIEEGMVSIWDVATRSPIYEWDNQTTGIDKLFYSPDGVLLVSRSNRVMRILHVETKRELFLIDEAIPLDAPPRYSPDGDYVLFADGDIVQVWDGEQETLHLTFSATYGTYRQVAYHPDGKNLAVRVMQSSMQNLFIWDMEAREFVRSLEIFETIERMAYHPAGHQLAATLIFEDQVTIIDLLTDERILTLEHDDWAMGLAYNADGTMLLTASYDGALRIWDAETGALLALLEGHTTHVYDAIFSPDDRMILSGGTDGTVRLWGIVD